MKKNYDSDQLRKLKIMMGIENKNLDELRILGELQSAFSDPKVDLGVVFESLELTFDRNSRAKYSEKHGWHRTTLQKFTNLCRTGYCVITESEIAKFLSILEREKIIEQALSVRCTSFKKFEKLASAFFEESELQITSIIEGPVTVEELNKTPEQHVQDLEGHWQAYLLKNGTPKNRADGFALQQTKSNQPKNVD